MIGEGWTDAGGRSCRTLRQQGYASVAVYADADTHSPHVTTADRAVRIGQVAPREAYLGIEAMLAAARQAGWLYLVASHVEPKRADPDLAVDAAVFGAVALLLVVAVPSWSGWPERHSLYLVSIPVSIVLLLAYVLITVRNLRIRVLVAEVLRHGEALQAEGFASGQRGG